MKVTVYQELLWKGFSLWLLHIVVFNEWKSLNLRLFFFRACFSLRGIAESRYIYPSGNNWAGTFLRHKKPRQYKKDLYIDGRYRIKVKIFNSTIHWILIVHMVALCNTKKKTRHHLKFINVVHVIKKIMHIII